MARKRKQKIKGFRRLLFFIFTPVVVWVIAFVVWLYWNSIMPLFRQSGASFKPPPSPTRSTHRGEHKEQISDEERKKLNEILKNKTK